LNPIIRHSGNIFDAIVRAVFRQTRSIIVVLAVMICLLTPAGGYGQESQNVIEKIDDGTIDWTQGIITATGMTAPFKKTSGKSIDRQVALTAAKTLTGRKLIETVKMVRINSRMLISTLVDEDKEILLKLDNMVKNAEITEQKYLSDYTLEITMQLKMMGGFSQLVLPAEVQQLDTLKMVGPDGKQAKATSGNTFVSSGGRKEKIYSGLIIDADGLGVKAALVIKVLDEDGKEVYGPAFASREFAVQFGMSHYVRNLAQARNDDRVGPNPLITKGLTTEGPGKSNIVISNADAAKLRAASEHLRFMRECRVVVIIH
jgi:hypothetical protein